MEYTAVIRTLGTAGNKYQQLLDSLVAQTIRPAKIIVYIAEGYPLPEETVGIEEYVYVKKGMVAQRALSYKEVNTEYILFLDDDLAFPADFVEHLYKHLVNEKADVISPDIYPNNAERSALGKIMMAVSGRMLPRYNDKIWGYKVMRNAGYSYNAHPTADIYCSQTNAGACFLCRKTDFLKIHFEDENWLDKLKYALGDDQIMYYKMYLMGLKQLTLYRSGIKHLDAGNNMLRNKEKEQCLISSDFYFKPIFWHRFIYLPEKSVLKRVWSIICIGYALAFTLIISLVKLDLDIFRVKRSAIREAILFIKDKEYKNIPIVKKNI